MYRIAPLLLLAGCIETNLGKIDPDPQQTPDVDSGEPPAVDSEPPVEESEPGDSAVVQDCSEALPEDEAVALLEDCAGEVREVDYTLVEAARVDIGPVGGTWTLAAGRFTDGDADGDVDQADPMHILIDADGPILLDHQLQTVASWASGSWLAFSTLGEVDGLPGVDAVTSYYYRGSSVDQLGAFNAGGALRTWATTEDSTGLPWLIDIDGDGALDVLNAGEGYRLSDGARTFQLSDFDASQDSGMVRAADLDLDGVPEVIASSDHGTKLGLYDAAGQRLTLCRDGANRNGWWSALAIGDLDGDPQGEFAAAGGGFLVTCDTDGAPLNEVSIRSAQPALLGLAQLDTDALPELIYSDQRELVALDDDLGELWTVALGPFWAPFSLADFEGDGVHEIVVHSGGRLSIFDARGVELAGLDTATNGSWRQSPVIADLDADGLAELFIFGDDVGAVIVENPAGGWALPGASHTWPGPEHYPGDRDADGAVPAPFPWWQDRSTNVWQGLPVGAGQAAELDVAISEVCVERCDGDALITLRVENRGVVGAAGVELVLENIFGLPLDTRALDPLPAGRATFLQLRLPVADVQDGFVVTVDADGRVEECQDEHNEARWEERLCP